LAAVVSLIEPARIAEFHSRTDAALIRAIGVSAKAGRMWQSSR
jgi:hypothetical protein